MMLRTFSVTKVLSASRNAVHPLHRKVCQIHSELEKSQWFSADQLYDIQTRKLRKLCCGAFSKSEYYRKMFNDGNIAPDTITLEVLPQLPLLTKEVIRGNFNKLVDQSISKKETQLAVTGGSSGTPLRILRTNHSYQYAAAIRLRNRSWTGFQLGMQYVRVWGAPTDVDATKKIKERALNWLNNIRVINAFDVTEHLLENLYWSLAANPQSHIESYSNILYEFSRFIEEKKFPPLNMHSVVSSAGTLYSFQREMINKNISKNVYNRYGCREVGNIAHECEAHTGMHINMERYIVEILDADSEGKGKIIVTDLENEALPIIRYVIEDDGCLSKAACPCGRNLTMFAQVTGRTLDVILTPGGRKISGELFPHLFKDFPEILTGQVIQREIGKIEILLRLTGNDEGNDFIEPLCRAIKKYIGDEMMLDVKLVDKLSVNKTGKYRPVINTLLSEK